MEDDAALEGEAALIDHQIASVSRALERIEKGTYGECVRCGGATAAARHDVRPEAALCIECASSEQGYPPTASGETNGGHSRPTRAPNLGAALCGSTNRDP